MTLPPANQAKLKINGAQVQGFELQDTQHAKLPGRLTAARVEYFPGSSRPFVIKGAARQDMLRPTGMLRAESFDALYTLIDEHKAWASQTTIADVTYHGTTYSSAPMAFELLTEFPEAYSQDNGQTVGAQIPVRFVFQVLEP